MLVLLSVVGVLAGAASTIAELLRPARPMPYRQVLLRDIVAWSIYIALITPAAERMSDKFGPYVQFHWPIGHWPLALRIVTYFLVADLGSYGFHRLMHTKWMWRIHKWHHAPTYMYWFAGVRATLWQQFLFNLPVVFAVPILFGAPHWVFVALPLEVIVRNDWMHMNVAWRSSWLEWVLVTPRYHAIHHSATHRGNYGSLFSIWDRVFRTRIDPDTVTEPFAFGTGEQDHPVRVWLGV
jgi:sterol desaturase/sphingolipid hydroxylase (fatty acid hydroxylase superfamily)